MITPEWLEYQLNALEAHKELQESVIRDIARRIAKTGALTETADWQLAIAEEAGVCREEITRLVAAQSGKSQKEIEALFEEAEKENFNFPESGFRVYGSDMGKVSPMVQRIWTAAATKTCTDAVNLTKTIALTSQSAYISACDLAHLQVASGAFDYNTAIANAIRSASGQGATVLYPSGHKDSVDVAVRRAVLTSVNQTAGQCMLLKAEELGHDLMEITAHAGARPSHAAWQGQIVSRSGQSGYLSLDDIGYGDPGGFMGVNCRHNWSMYFEGSPRAYTPEMLSEYNNATVSYNGENMPLYEATQRQRAFERKVRKTRNELVGLDEAVKVNPELKSEFAATSMKLKQQEAALKDFCSQTGIRYESPRVQVQGFGKSTSQKAVWANKKALTEAAESAKIELRSRISDGSISLKINAVKQAPHMHDTRAAGKSYFTISIDELQDILNSKYATGTVRVFSNGQIKETITCEKDVGFCVSLDDGIESATNRFTIHYSKRRTHCVPTKRR